MSEAHFSIIYYQNIHRKCHILRGRFLPFKNLCKIGQCKKQLDQLLLVLPISNLFSKLYYQERYRQISEKCFLSINQPNYLGLCLTLHNCQKNTPLLLYVKLSQLLKIITYFASMMFRTNGIIIFCHLKIFRAFAYIRKNHALVCFSAKITNIYHIKEILKIFILFITSSLYLY